MTDILETIDRLKRELDALRPLPAEAVARVAQKLRIEANYHSNAIEGNTLTLGETRSLILHGLTARGKPLRHHLDIQGYDNAAKAVEEAVATGAGEITHAFIRHLHGVLLKEAYEMPAVTPDGAPAKRRIGIGEYKTAPNNVVTTTGEIFHYSLPESVHMEMTDLLDWLREQESAGEHPVVAAATFHYRFVRIHPFDDGNGRMARLLMNMILIRHGYTIAIVRCEDRDRYIDAIESAGKTGELAEFIAWIASCCEYFLDLHLRATRREAVDDSGDIKREIERFKQALGKQRGQTLPKDYSERVIHPFRRHCEAQIDSMSDMFDRKRHPCYRLRTADAVVVSDNGEAEEWPRFRFLRPSRGDAARAEELDADIDLRYRLDRFRGKEINVDIRIHNLLASGESIWEFRESLSGFEESYSGRNVEELKNIFDDLLRAVMRALGRRVP